VCIGKPTVATSLEKNQIKNQGPMMAPTLLSDWPLFSATHIGVAHFSEVYCTT